MRLVTASALVWIMVLGAAAPAQTNSVTIQAGQPGYSTAIPEEERPLSPFDAERAGLPSIASRRRPALHSQPKEGGEG